MRTDRGHEGQAQLHWHVEDQGIRHVYIEPRSPQLNGKVERSHRSDQEEFYQLLTYKGDVDLAAKLEEWERFYNYDRPHGAFRGKTPSEALRSLLSLLPRVPRGSLYQTDFGARVYSIHFWTSDRCTRRFLFLAWAMDRRVDFAKL